MTQEVALAHRLTRLLKGVENPQFLEIKYFKVE